MDERGLASFSRGTPRGATLEWPTTVHPRKLASARAVTVAKEAAYQKRTARRLGKTLAAVAACRTPGAHDFIDASIKADTQAYYPWITATPAISRPCTWRYKSQSGRPRDPFDGMTRARRRPSCRRRFLADVRPAATPMVEGARAAAAGAPNRPGSAPRHARRRQGARRRQASPRGRQARDPAGKGGVDEPPFVRNGTGVAAEPGLTRASLSDKPGKPAAPEAKGRARPPPSAPGGGMRRPSAVAPAWRATSRP